MGRPGRGVSQSEPGAVRRFHSEVKRWADVVKASGSDAGLTSRSDGGTEFSMNNQNLFAALRAGFPAGPRQAIAVETDDGLLLFLARPRPRHAP